MTGTCPGRKTAALERRPPCPLLSKAPAMHTPLAWLRRNPGCTPLTSSKPSITRAWVRRPGESQPATKAKHPTTPKTAAPIAASLTSTPLPARDESRYGPGKLGSFGTAPSLLHAELGWIDRNHAAVDERHDPVFRSVEPSCYARAQLGKLVRKP